MRTMSLIHCPKMAARFVSMKFARVAFCFAFFAATSVLGAPPAGYYLVWSDEFNGTTLDTSKWDYWLLGGRRDAVNTTAAVAETNGA